MANALLTSTNIAKLAANIVGKDLTLGALVFRDLEADFGNGSGKSVTVRVPGAVASQRRDLFDTTTPLVSDEIAEASIIVELTDHVYDSVPLSDGTLDLEIIDFTKQIVEPQARAIVKHVERAVAAAMSATPETTLAYAPATPAKVFTQVRKTLRDNGVSTDSPLIAACGSGVYADLLDGPAGTFDADGKVRGFTVVESNRLASDEIVGFVKEAFALAVRAPSVPEGAPFGASLIENGFALRHIRSYDPTVAVERSLVSTYLGVKALPLAVDNEDGTISLVANGGAVRVLTA